MQTRHKIAICFFQADCFFVVLFRLLQTFCRAWLFPESPEPAVHRSLALCASSPALPYLVSPWYHPENILSQMICHIRLLPDKHLCPIMSVCHVTNADLGVRSVENIGAMSARVHPGVYHRLRCSLSIGNIFSCSPKR